MKKKTIVQREKVMNLSSVSHMSCKELIGEITFSISHINVTSRKNFMSSMNYAMAHYLKSHENGKCAMKMKMFCRNDGLSSVKNSKLKTEHLCVEKI